jgi:hypothetical protein
VFLGGCTPKQSKPANRVRKIAQQREFRAVCSRLVSRPTTLDASTGDGTVRSRAPRNSYRCFSVQSRPDIIESLESRLANKADCAACHRALPWTHALHEGKMSTRNGGGHATVG